jgi:hypothetical protein
MGHAIPFANLNGRVIRTQRLREKFREFADQLGGIASLTPAKFHSLEMLVTFLVEIAEHQEQRHLNGKTIDLRVVSAASANAQRLMRELGLTVAQEEPEDDTSLEDYLLSIGKRISNAGEPYDDGIDDPHALAPLTDAERASWEGYYQMSGWRPKRRSLPRERLKVRERLFYPRGDQ